MIVLDDSLVHLAGIFHNMYLKLEESEDNHYLNDDGWKFHIHDANEVPILAITIRTQNIFISWSRKGPQIRYEKGKRNLAFIIQPVQKRKKTLITLPVHKKGHFEP